MSAESGAALTHWENVMRVEVQDKGSKRYWIAVVAGVVGGALLISRPFASHDHSVANVSAQAPSQSSAPAPALLDPALRSLDGVAAHG